jgi:tetratricopeptide (TPR) repeat protein/transcriptional regulator with XRE-family HTH domain
MKKTTKFAPNLHLKRARVQRGWSQEYVAREVGTDAFTVSRWERGVAMASPHFRQQLCTHFGLSVAQLGLVPAEMETPDDQATGQLGEIPTQLPSPPSLLLDPAIPPPLGHSLVGRDELFRQLKQRLLSESPVALSAINGLPGVGKTALATALAHDDELQASFADGVLWAGLGYEPDVLGLLSHWGTLLQCAPADLTQRGQTTAWATSIHAAIGQRRMVLIIDDAWQITQALVFQVGGPHCAHLLTTRFPEIARRFSAEGTIVVRELDDTDGRRLLLRLAPEVVQAEPQAAQELVSAVGGLPLALTLLGNYLRAQAHSGQPRRVRAALHRLRSADERLHLHESQPPIGGHPGLSAGTPLSLQVVIGMSDQQVSKQARAALRALAVFPPKPNTFAEETAVTVSALPVETLDELTDAGLLESSGPERYTLHQTIADYARTHVTDESVTGRLVDYFVSYVEAHAADAPALESESANIVAALEAAFERGMLPALVKCVHAFVPLLITRGRYSVAEAQLRRSLHSAQALKDDASQATAWLHLGKIAEQRGDYLQAQAHWQNSLILARESEHRHIVAQTLRELGGLAWVQGQLHQAHLLLAEALDMLRQLGEQCGVADTLNGLGKLVAQQGEPERGRLLYEEALAVYRDLNDQRGIALTQHNLGVLAREQGQPQQARVLYEEALTIHRCLGDQRSAAIVLGNLGNLARHQGQPEQAHQLLEEALVLHRQMENRRSLAFSLLNLGGLAAGQGQFEQAHLLLDEALIMFQGLGEGRQSALTLLDLGILARQQGQPERALQLYTEALTSLLQLDDQREAAITRQELGALAREQGQLEEAQQLLTESLATTRQIRDRQSVANALKELGLLMQQRGQLEQALHAFLSAEVGLALVHSPDTSIVGEILRQVRTRMDESTFLSIAERVAREPSEPAYGLTQMAWAAAILRCSIKT